MTLPTISPAKAKELLAKGAVLVDIREADEHARERIPGALHAPLSTLGDRLPAGGPMVVFHCRSGMRTAMNAGRLGQAAGCEAYILEGGIDAWRAAGLPVAKGAR
jgi:rhodanese-related sulfurtransferase